MTACIKLVALAHTLLCDICVSKNLVVYDYVGIRGENSPES